MNTSRHPQSSPDDLLALADTELSLAARLGQVMLLLAFVVMVGVIGLLGITEPSLPSRARIVFAVIIAIGVLGTLLTGVEQPARPARAAPRHRLPGGSRARRHGCARRFDHRLRERHPCRVCRCGVRRHPALRHHRPVTAGTRKLAALIARRHALAEQLKAGG